MTPELVRDHNLTPAEYNRIKRILGRSPNFTELGIFSVMWSEHCSYKNSKPILKLFPTEGPNILVKAGEENAGIVDIGNGLGVCFKIESHNHPSAVEPFQGAATGVGGIIRDIFTMGARPILLMNSLRFGNPKKQNVKRLISGVVGGISFYGNCIGIPTVGGEVYFDETYEGNPLVNALCLGIVRHEEIILAKAKGIDNPVFYVGATTGRDGLGGASFASRELTEESEEDRPAVQVGDPFMEKLLLEACLELFKTGYSIAVQDMGAAGLTCSTCETASRGNTGIEIDIAKVPKRETGMIPYEVMLSESQERMLVIARKGKEEEVKKIFDKWDLNAVVIGKVTDGGLMRVKDNGRVAAEIPAKSLSEDAPVHHRKARKPDYLKKTEKFRLSDVKEPKSYETALKKLLASPTIASKRWVWEQYDHMVQTNTLVLPGSDSAVVRIRGTDKAIAITTDCNAAYCYLDPYEGGKIAVAEAARNLVSSGARPLAITNCLNFGNPMKPEIFYQFKRCVEGMSEACRRFNTPVTGGNVSFYNENPKGAIDPTPVVGMIGLIEGLNESNGYLPVTSNFKDEGDVIILLGDTREEIGGSEYLKVVHNLKTGKPPRLSLDTELALHKVVLSCIKRKLIKSAHDCSEGGLAVTIAESCVSNYEMPNGAIINLSNIPCPRIDCLLFGESQSRIVITCPEKDVHEVIGIARANKFPLDIIGKVQGKRLRINGWVNNSVEELRDIWWNSFTV
ncbi:MAG: phosphoribosylformylglycinamidine synthase subunit PurL [Candidatus Omnitrophica bacterium]|nr:phosphoribosylformylglycinamidine synthase subunit PurL [Candidatus Omnitrophota bacterium]